MLQNKNHDNVPQPRDLKRKTTYFIEVHQSSMVDIRSTKWEDKEATLFSRHSKYKEYWQGKPLFVALGDFKIGFTVDTCLSFK
jgi:hypothetical protein